MRELNLDQLRTLVTVLDLGSFSAAARALHLAQPTVSLHVSELESRLGAQLLARGGARVHATPVGELLVDRARRLLQQADETVNLVKRHRDGRVGRVRLAASTGAMVHLLPQLLEALDDALPDIDVQVTVGRSAMLMAKLFMGDVDLALVAVPQSRYPNIRVVPWRTAPMMAMLPARWEAPKIVTPKWLAERPLILNEPDTHIRRQVLDWFGAAGLQPQVRMEMAFNEVTRRLVAAGYGAAILPFEHPSESMDGRIQVVRVRPAMERKIAIGHRPVQLMDTLTRTVLDTVLRFGADEAGKRPR